MGTLILLIVRLVMFTPVHAPVCAQLDLYYNGFCNSVLWQLFHYVPLNIDSWQKMAEHKAMQMQWQAYQVRTHKILVRHKTCKCFILTHQGRGLMQRLA